MKHIVVLTGAGISAESGIKTFRDADGLWEGHNVNEVATPEGWNNNMSLVLDFYNERRKQLLKVKPNLAHNTLAALEQNFNIDIITQNIDDLHERAGSSNVLHLHGELLKVRSAINPQDIYPWHTDLKKGDLCENGHQLRPHVVWFGEAVPMLEKAIEITSKANILIIIGTSMQVYPAASLIKYAQPNIPIYFIDPKPAIHDSEFSNLTIVRESATQGMTIVSNLLKANC